MSEVRSISKSPEAFRTISEAAEEIGVPQHVLRFWETKFSFIRPMKRAGGRRFYRPQDIAVLKGVRRLLHDEGYTIKGVQKLHKEQGLKRLVAAADPSAAASFDEATFEADAEPVETAAGALDLTRLRAVLKELEAAKARLDNVLRT